MSVSELRIQVRASMTGPGSPNPRAGAVCLLGDEIILAQARSQRETDEHQARRMDQRRRVGVGFDGRGNSDTFRVKRRHFLGSRYVDVKSAGPITP